VKALQLLGFLVVGTFAFLTKPMHPRRRPVTTRCYSADLDDDFADFQVKYGEMPGESPA